MATLQEVAQSLLDSELRYAILRQRVLDLLPAEEAHLLLLLEHEGERRLRARDKTRDMNSTEVVAECKRLLPQAQESALGFQSSCYGADLIRQVVDDFGHTDLEDLIQEARE